MSSTNSLFLDTNILMEVLLDRDKKPFVRDILSKYENLFISMLTVHQVYYFGIKEKISYQDLEFFISQFTIFDLTAESYAKAVEIVADNDFEDALQLAIALNNNQKTIFSLDDRMKKRYSNLVRFV